jgi:phage terminase large subunit-like protein
VTCRVRVHRAFAGQRADVPGGARLDEAVRNGWLRHDGNRKLRSHVLNAVARSLGDAKWKFDRPGDAKGERRKNYPIDLLTGVLMGHNVAVDEHDRADAPLLEVWG